MARTSNRQVVQELKEGNRLGCRHVVELYQDRLIEEATRVFHIDLMDAEELVSDVLLAVVTKIAGFEFKKSENDFHFWVMTIFRNRVRDFVRHSALTDGLMEIFEESLLDDEEGFSTTEEEVLKSIVREYQESITTAGQPNSDGEEKDVPERMRLFVEVLDEMEAWERVLLRCRALDVPYEEIAHYTEKTPNQLKVYHRRVKKKFVKMLHKRSPEHFTL